VQIGDYRFSTVLVELLVADSFRECDSHSLENPPLHLHSRSKVCGCDCDLVAELAKRLRQPPGVSHLGLGIRFDAVLYKPHPLMQDLPHHTAEPMGDGPDGGLIDGGTPPESNCLSS